MFDKIFNWVRAIFEGKGAENFLTRKEVFDQVMGMEEGTSKTFYLLPTIENLQFLDTISIRAALELGKTIVLNYRVEKKYIVVQISVFQD
jgi:hypothetical protein